MRNRQTNIPTLNNSPLHIITPLALLGYGAFGAVYLIQYKNLTQLHERLKLSCDYNELNIPTNFSSDDIYEVFYGEQHASAKETIYNDKKEELKAENLLRHENTINTNNLCVLKKESFSSIKNKGRIVGIPDLFYEHKILSNISHPLIIAYIDKFEFNGCAYLIQEYFRGMDLKSFIEDAITSRKSLHQKYILMIIFQIGAALDILHQKGIIHRDLKPGNILINKYFFIKLIDFGLAITEDEGVINSKNHNEVVGSLYYMSPQAVQKKCYTNKTDVWSLGVILYELLSFKKPFDKEGNSVLNSTQTTAESIVQNNQNMLENYSDNINYLISKLLSKEELDRFSIREFLCEDIMIDAGDNFLRYYELFCTKYGNQRDKNNFNILKKHFEKIKQSANIYSRDELNSGECLKKEVASENEKLKIQILSRNFLKAYELHLKKNLNIYIDGCNFIKDAIFKTQKKPSNK